MLSPPHREGGVGAVRVEVRGANSSGERLTLVAGVAELVGTCAAATAAAFTGAIVRGDLDPGVTVAGEERLDTIGLLREVERLGVRLQEFTGIPHRGPPGLCTPTQPLTNEPRSWLTSLRHLIRRVEVPHCHGCQSGAWSASTGAASSSSANIVTLTRRRRRSSCSTDGRRRVICSSSPRTKRLRRGVRLSALTIAGTAGDFRSPTAFTLEDVADDAAAVLRHLGATDVVAIGYSMGGPISMLLARRHPDLVAGLVAQATALEWSGTLRERLRWRFLPAMGALLRSRVAGRFVKKFLEKTLRRGTWATAVHPRGCAESHSARTLAQCSQAGRALGAYDATDWAGSLDMSGRDVDHDPRSSREPP